MATIGSLLATNFPARVAGLLQIGQRTVEQVAAILGPSFPAYRDYQLLSAVGRVRDALAAGAALEAAQPFETIGRVDIPIDPNLPQAYTYGVSVDAVNTVSGKYQHQFVFVDSNSQLTREQVLEQVQQQIDSQNLLRGFGGRTEGFRGTFTATNTITYIARRT